MSTSALLFMIAVQGTVTAVTVYYFYKVLKAPAKDEPDSYSDNDD